MNFAVCVMAAVAEDDAAEVQIERLSHRRKHDAAGGDSEAYEMGDLLGPQDHFEIVAGEGAHAVLVDDDLVRRRGSSVEKRGGLGAEDEPASGLDPGKDGMVGADLRVAWAKSDADMNDRERPGSSRFQHAGGG